VLNLIVEEEKNLNYISLPCIHVAEILRFFAEIFSGGGIIYRLSYNYYRINFLFSTVFAFSTL